MQAGEASDKEVLNNYGIVLTGALRTQAWQARRHNIVHRGYAI